MFRAHGTLPRCRSQAVLHRGYCSAIYKVRYRTDSVAAKASTAVTVPTPLFGLVYRENKVQIH